MNKGILFIMVLAVVFSISAVLAQYSSSAYPSPTPSSSIYPTSSSTYYLSSNKVEAEVSTKLKTESYVSVIVELYDEVFDKSKLSDYKNKVKVKEDGVLSTLGTDFSLKYKYGMVPGFSGKVNKNGLNKLAMNSNVKRVYSDKMYKPLLAESVPLINGNDAHNTEYNGQRLTGKGQVVCVIDTGVDYTHPHFGGSIGSNYKVIGGYDFVDNDADPMDVGDGHGTHVAGIVAVNSALKGVAPDARILAVRVCNEIGCSGSAMEAGIDWCLQRINDLGTSIITMSIGGQSFDSASCPQTEISNLINRAYDLNIPFTIASGNGGVKNGISEPACTLKAISVGSVYDANVGSRTFCFEKDGSGNCIRSCTDSVTNADMVSCFSNGDSNLDFLAPGSRIESTDLGGGYSIRVGTSAATPHVAGVIALMKQQNPSLTVDQIVNILKTHSPKVVDAGNGVSTARVDAKAIFGSLGCQIAENGATYNSNIKLCPYKYYLPAGIKIGANNVNVDCDGASLIGTNRVGVGISNLGGFDNVLINKCNIKNYDKGISIYSSTSNINNVVSNNILEGNKQGMIVKSFQSGKIIGNSIRNNTNGIAFDGASTGNDISNNDIVRNTDYDLKNNQNVDIDVFSNWFGSKYEIGINGRIIDFFDIGTLGKVNFIPFLIMPVYPLENNNAPILNFVGDRTIKENEKLEISLTGTDSDNDKLRFATNADKILNGVSFNVETGVFSWTPTEDDAGKVFEVIFEISDGYLTDEESITISVESSGIKFLRGDSNSDGSVDISDAVNILNVLFSGQGAIDCMDSADANDDGSVDISDGVYILNFLFSGGAVIKEPYPGVGLDSTLDSLTCESYTGGAGGAGAGIEEILNDPEVDEDVKDILRNYN
ncbi:MAG: S8 family serine peptidase [Nanoarchaeota archaeon]|nr:S8 family serine peptidase [Nanoarchaeota archaeon]